MKDRKPLTDQDRREYQKKYYRAHMAKAKAYQVAYNLKHRKTSTPKGKVADQGIPKRCLSLGDLTKAPTIKFERQVRAILNRNIGFTM